MKTTVELSAALMERAKRIARRQGTTLRALIEAGLRKELAERSRRSTFVLRDVAYRGKGLSGQYAARNPSDAIDASYEGRGS